MPCELLELDEAAVGGGGASRPPPAVAFLVPASPYTSGLTAWFALLRRRLGSAERPAMSAAERVLDAYPRDRPAMLEILAEDPLSPASGCGDHHERIPERQRVALFEFSRFEDVARRDGGHWTTAVAPPEGTCL